MVNFGSWSFPRSGLILVKKWPKLTLVQGSPGQFYSRQNHLALNTEFQRSSIPGRKVVGLRKFQKFSKKFFSVIWAPKVGEKTPQPVKQVNACGKPLFRREKCRLERFFIVTWHWLLSFWRWPLDTENWYFECLSHLKAIEIQNFLFKTCFIAVSLSINTIWCLLM